MNLSRREFLQALAAASVLGLSRKGMACTDHIAGADELYDIPAFGNVSFLHFTDSHAQLLPGFYREPESHVGVGSMSGKIPHIVGEKLLKHYKLKTRSANAYALCHLDFAELAHQYGCMGGYAHLATLIKNMRASRPNSLLLDGGDTWQGSATSLWTQGQDMVDASLLLGVDVMTGHWEFTYGMKRVREIVEHDLKDKIEFLAQNVLDLDFEDRVFKSHIIREINGVKVAVIGQAFPYVPIAHPRHLMEKWQFGIREELLQKLVDDLRAKGAQVVVLLSHNGMDVDLKLASRVSGVDAILGGHTHDAVPITCEIKNRSGTTLVINSGSAGKFLSVLDFDFKGGRIRDYRFRLLPIFSNLIKADKEMSAHISKVRAPYIDKLTRKVAISEELLFRRGTFNGTFDQLIVDALIKTQDAQIAFSPGFRWGMNILPGEAITFEDIMNQTAITYPQVTRNDFSGAQVKEILEDLADNRFNHDPYLQQGGDMVRVGKLKYTIDTSKPRGFRIQNLQLDDKPLDAKKKYVVTGWASVARNPQGNPIWDVVTQYVEDQKVVKIDHINTPKLI